MATGAYNGNAYEKAVMDLLAKEGWTVLYGPDIDRDYREALWEEPLRDRVFALNCDTPDAAIEDALMKVKRI